MGLIGTATVNLQKAVKVFLRPTVKRRNILANCAVSSTPGDQSGCELSLLIRFSLGRLRPPGM
jgi:hypothetical protein